MSPLVETFVAALALSGLACACLALLPNAPPRVRLALAIGGLAAWLVPWGWIRIALPQADNVRLSGPLERIAMLGGGFSGDASSPYAALGYVVAVLFFVGFALFVRDWLALHRCTRHWRAASRPGDALRALLPPELRVAAEIRVVRGSRVAAASGWLVPTVWIGDRHAGASLRLILVHEMWHARRRDPVRLALIAAVRRVYWWNPLVAHLARQAVLMIESECDHRSAALLGKPSYIAELAALMLDDASAAPRLLATVRSASFNVARLRLLGAPLRLRTSDVALLCALFAVGAVTVAASVVELGVAGHEAATHDARLPLTPAGRALQALLGAVNTGDTDLLRETLGAYTPQELPLPFPSGSELRVVDVLHSEPLRIEYVVEAGGGTRRIGQIEVADAAAREITRSSLRELP
jgi:hypothetical protein